MNYYSCVAPQITAHNFYFWVNQAIQNISGNHNASIVSFWVATVLLSISIFSLWLLFRGFIEDIRGVILAIIGAVTGVSSLVFFLVGFNFMGISSFNSEWLEMKSLGYKNVNPQQILDLENALREC